MNRSHTQEQLRLSEILNSLSPNGINGGLMYLKEPGEQSGKIIAILGMHGLTFRLKRPTKKLIAGAKMGSRDCATGIKCLPFLRHFGTGKIRF